MSTLKNGFPHRSGWFIGSAVGVLIGFFLINTCRVDAAETETSRAGVPGALGTILAAADESFLTLRAGAGRKLKSGTAVFPCSVTIPGSDKTAVWVPVAPRKPYVRADMGSGTGALEGRRQYDSLVAQVKTAYSDWKAEPSQSSDSESEDRSCDFQLRGRGPMIGVSYSYTKDDRVWDVSLTISLPRSEDHER